MIKNVRGGMAILASVLAVAIGAWPVGGLAAATQPRLGTALNYAVIGGSTITNTGSSVISGKIALSPGSALTGFPPGTNSGTDIANGAAVQAQSDLNTGYTDAANATPFIDMTATPDLGGKVLNPGVYRFSSSAAITGVLTLDGQGSTNSPFIFQIGSTLTTASNSQVVLRNGAAGCAVFWQVTSSATLGTGTSFQGNLMTLASITMTTGSTIGVGGGVNGGRAMARIPGAVTLDTVQIIPPPTSCVFAAAPTPSPTPRLPDTGGIAPSGGFPWIPVVLAALITGILVTPYVRSRRRRS